ncbi:hypothetical protein A9995_15715, partial [Erythrobacter sp. QSSC1-22B]|uniref:DUF1996 domain-containing protein n=1 Tax=Erythrobacter sp. QSSC1-22B TaxID=1860125 RepID=UPI000805D499
NLDGTVEAQMVASGLNVDSLLGPMRLAGSGAPDVVGAFRFLCAPSHYLYDDPIVMPGRPGEFHLHHFFGNTGANANSTYKSLRTTGDSTCNNALNRSAYWQPAMLQTLVDGTQQVVVPNYNNIYYKRRPANDPWFSKMGDIPVDVPRGLKFIFGWPDQAPLFKCLNGSRNVTGWMKTMEEALAPCTVGMKLDISVSSPYCWDGKNLDSPDHRSHMSYGGGGGCPDTHPYHIPVYTNQSIYTIQEGDRPETWHLASDQMMTPDGPRGQSFHTDYFMAWEDTVIDRWMAACINKLLNCSSGDLGDGRIMKQSALYQELMAKPPQRLPVPKRSAP